MKYANDFYVDNNDVVRWKSNDRVPFDDMLTNFLLADLICQENVLRSMTARKEEDIKSLEEYVVRRQKYGYSAEEKAEMKNAFGDQEVFDIFTGKAIQYD